MNFVGGPQTLKKDLWSNSIMGYCIVGILNFVYDL